MVAPKGEGEGGVEEREDRALVGVDRRGEEAALQEREEQVPSV